jgi:hypothetical protein
VFIALCILMAFALALMGQSPTQQLSPVMTEVAVRMESLRKKLDSKSAIDAANDAERLQSLFIQAAGISGQLARSKYRIPREQT